MERTHVINCGNHWLQTDDHQTKVTWVDLAHATLHTKEWADRFKEEQRKAGRRVDVIAIDDAIQAERKAGLEAVKSVWLGDFAEAVRKAFDGYTNEGLWANAHMYHSQNLSVPEAVKQFGKSLKLKAKVA